VNTNIQLVYNNGFKWCSFPPCHVKGYAFDEKGQYLHEQELVAHFNTTLGLADFRQRVSCLNGSFSIILELDDTFLVAVDPVRTFPIFYTSTKEGWLISDSVEYLEDQTGESNLDPITSSEFLALGFVSGSETLTSGITQVQAGEIIHLKGKSWREDDREAVEGGFYSSYQTSNTFDPGEDELKDHLDSVSENIFNRLIKSLDNRTALISLSGGYDSRFIAAKLKQKKYEKVICFAYGRQGNRDMGISGRVAAELGYDWIPVVYTEELIGNFQEDPMFHDYVRYSANHTSMFYMQDYFAVKYLRDNELIPDDSIFIPGHTADFFAGSNFLKHGLHSGQESLETTAKRIFDVKYSICSPHKREKIMLRKRILASLQQKSKLEGAYPYSIHEDWDLKEKFAKFIVNSCKVYSFFGYEYRLPFYDKEFHDFFRDLSFELKVNKELYDAYLEEGIFSELGLNYPEEIQPSEKLQKLAHLKSVIRRALPARLFLESEPKEDPICYQEITRKLKQDMAKRGISIKLQGKTYNSIIIQWYLGFLKIK
jgi:asparagine synthase (glutamine-hydrolysing)